MNLPHLPPERPMLVLPAQCGTAAAADLKAKLAAVCLAPTALVDAGAVETVGQAALQLLVAARIERPDFAFTAVSPAFAAAVHGASLGPALGLPPVTEPLQ